MTVTARATSSIIKVKSLDRGVELTEINQQASYPWSVQKEILYITDPSFLLLYHKNQLGMAQGFITRPDCFICMSEY